MTEESSAIATLAIIPPRLVGVPGFDSPLYRSYNLAQGAAYREGDFLTLTTVGTISTPTPQGSMATSAGPSLGQAVSISSTAATVANGVTITGVSSAGAPATTYYVVLTGTATTNETLPGAEFIVNCAAGFLFSVAVAASAVPAAATNFAAYVGVYQGGEALQQATKTTTAIGAAFTITSPLTNNRGINRAASNASTNIAGIALADSTAQYVLGPGGSFLAGGPGNLLGTWMPASPLGPIDPTQGLAASLVNAQPVEITLKQTWQNSLIGTSFGLTLDTSGYFVADTTATAAGTIIEKVFGSNADVGQVGDSNTRVKVFFNASAVI